MRSGASVERQRHQFLVLVPVALATFVLVGVLLQDGMPRGVREGASALGLVLAGLFLAVSCARRARLTSGRRRRSWLMIMAGAIVAIMGNVWAAAVGSDPVLSPSTVSDLSITAALGFCIVGVLGFPSVPRRGIDLVVIILDGLVIGGSVLIIASTLVYSELLDETRGSLASRFTTLLIPVLDVVLVVAALLLLLRSRGADRLALGLLALGFLAYVVTDLAFVVEVAEGDFAFGSPLDLGWIVGYGVLALAAWCPSVEVDVPAGDSAVSEVPDTALVYLVLMLAAVVQVTIGGGLGASTGFLWVLVAVAAAARQIALTRDNNTLRRGLEQRVRAQTADLRRLARQTEVLLTSVGDGIYGVDAVGRVTFVNPSGAEALGYDISELHQRSAHEAFHAPRPDGDPFPYEGCYIADAIRSGLVTAAEEDVYVRADGSVFPVEITASPLLDEDVVQGAVVVFRDVTQRREVDRMKNEFLSVVSHELRTPLTSIRGSLGLLASGKLGELTPRARSMATIALESSERLTRLINDILDLERIEAGNRSMDLAPVDAAQLLTRAVTELAGLARATGVRIEVGPTSGRVRADVDWIVQTLTNLLGNAVKYSAAGQAVVVDAEEQGDLVLFRVRDEGRGIPEDRLEAIFERFEQVDSSDARQKGGTGLGLAISRGIVERHGGRIWAQSELGVGTTVSFTLPAVRRSETTPPEQQAPAGSGPPPDAAVGGTVLIVEDDDALADVLVTLLAGHAVPVLRASTSADAVRVALEARPRIIVLDLDLDDGNGYQVVAQLRRHPHTAATHVIVYSAVDVDPERRPELTLGPTEFLTKGRVAPSDVEDRVLEALYSAAIPGGTPE